MSTPQPLNYASRTGDGRPDPWLKATLITLCVLASAGVVMTLVPVVFVWSLTREVARDADGEGAARRMAAFLGLHNELEPSPKRSFEPWQRLLGEAPADAVPLSAADLVEARTRDVSSGIHGDGPIWGAARVSPARANQLVAYLLAQGLEKGNASRVPTAGAPSWWPIPLTPDTQVLAEPLSGTSVLPHTDGIVIVDLVTGEIRLWMLQT